VIGPEGEPFDIGTAVPTNPEVAASAARLQGRGLVAVDGALALISVLLIVQMWLVTAALESLLAGHFEVAVPAAAISGLIFAGCAGLYYFVEALDRGDPNSSA
jgi:predicted Co/Zn/Cd cation transporter (cation efflux family)